MAQAMTMDKLAKAGVLDLGVDKSKTANVVNALTTGAKAVGGGVAKALGSAAGSAGEAGHKGVSKALNTVSDVARNNQALTGAAVTGLAAKGAVDTFDGN